MNIDWIEDATHYGIGDDCPVFFRNMIKGESYEFKNVYSSGIMSNWLKCTGYTDIPKDLIERPKKQEAWDGSGKPPIGIECEVRCNDVWSICKTLAYHQVSDTAVAVHFLDGSNSLFWCATFRPIKTAEQMAEEERDKARTEVLNAMTSKTMGLETEDQWQQRMKVVGEMLDMGYRKK